jgi:metallo-beta-lactamase family protein
LREGDLQRRFVFSGDLGQYDTPILRDPQTPKQADIVLMETTYGGRRHRDRQATIDEIGEIIKVAAETRGNILIPAFAVGRSQEVLYQLATHFDDWGVDRFKVFLDSPMAIQASEVYWNYRQVLDKEAQLVRDNAGDMPLLPNLELTRSSDESRAINEMKHSAIIVAASGMCTGGRILHHLRNNLANPGTQVIIVGYQANGTLGRRLVDGADEVRMFGQTIEVNAKIHTVGGLSAHGDQDDLARWYEGFDNKPGVYLVHGEDESKSAFKAYLHDRCAVSANIGQPGMKLDLVRGKLDSPTN